MTESDRTIARLKRDRLDLKRALRCACSIARSATLAIADAAVRADIIDQADAIERQFCSRRKKR